MDTGEIASLVVAFGGGTVLNQLLGNFLGRKKLGADASKIISEAAASTVTMIRGEADDLRKEVIELRKQIDRLQKLREEDDEQTRFHRRLLQDHDAWDEEVMARCATAVPVIQLRDRPPLYPVSTRFANPT